MTNKKAKITLDFTENMTKPLMEVNKVLGVSDGKLKNYQDTLKNNERLQGINKKALNESAEAIRRTDDEIQDLKHSIKGLDTSSDAYTRAKDKIKRLNETQEKNLKLHDKALKKEKSITDHQDRLAKKIKEIREEQRKANTEQGENLTLLGKIYKARDKLLGQKTPDGGTGAGGEKATKGGKDGKGGKGGKLKDLATKGGALATVATVGASALSAEQLENKRLADQAGIDVKRQKSRNLLGQKLGMTGEHINDVEEEMVNKIGEYKQNGELKTLQDGIKGTGIDLEHLLTLQRGEIMPYVMSKVQKLDPVVGASVLDQLGGGEANKFLTALNSQKLDYNKEIQHGIELQKITEQDLEKLQKANNWWNEFIFSFDESWGSWVSKQYDSVQKAKEQREKDIATYRNTEKPKQPQHIRELTQPKPISQPTVINHTSNPVININGSKLDEAALQRAVKGALDKKAKEDEHQIYRGY